MGKLLSWFKKYSVEDKGYIKISFHDGGDYDFCYANAHTIQCVFGQIRHIPSLDTLLENEEKLTVNEVIKGIESELVLPKDMLGICNDLLSDITKFIEPYSTESCPMDSLVSYVNMIKEKSEHGYYVVFELE